MSVPRPAMFVEMVTEPCWPARATISASCMWYFALRTVCGIFCSLSIRLSNSLDSTLAVPTSTGWPLPWASSDRLDHRVVFFAARLVDAIVLVDAADRPIRRDDVDIEPIDVVKLVRLGLGRAGHAGELLVETEVVLDGDRREGLRLAIDLHAFLGLDRLVQTIAPAAAGHFAAGEFIDDDDLVVLDDVFDVLLVEAVGPEELRDVVDPLRLRVAVLLPRRLLLRLFGIGEIRLVIDVGELREQIRQHKGVGIVGIEKVAALLGQVGIVLALLDREEQLFLEIEECCLAVGVLVKLELGLVDQLAQLGIFHHARETFVARLAELQLEQRRARLRLSFPPS